MHAIRITAVVCITTLVVLVGVLVYLNHQDRYLVLPQEKAMFVFDRTNGLVNYCTTENCQLVMPQGYAEATNMTANTLPGGQVFYYPTNAGVMGGAANAFPFTQHAFKSSLQTRPVGAPIKMTAGMSNWQAQAVMIPSSIMPTPVKAASHKKKGVHGKGDHKETYHEDHHELLDTHHEETAP